MNVQQNSVRTAQADHTAVTLRVQSSKGHYVEMFMMKSTQKLVEALRYNSEGRGFDGGPGIFH